MSDSALLASPVGLAVALTARRPPAARYQAWRYLVATGRLLVDAVEGRGPRVVLLSLPPRHGKSSLLLWTCVWLFVRQPVAKVIWVSYSAGLAESMSARIREALREFGPALGVRLSADIQTRARWETAAGGQLLAAGVGGGITGYGANLLIADDLLADAGEARSPTAKLNAWTWLQETASTRLEPDGTIILCGSRWAQDDPAGRLAAQCADDGTPLTVINLPAIAEVDESFGVHKRRAGEALCPQRFDLEALEQIRARVGAYGWAAQYCGRPVPLGGGMFERRWLRVVDKAPEAAAAVRFWDLASSGSAASDWTAGVKVARARDGSCCVLDVARFRVSPHERNRRMLAVMAADGRVCKQFVERGPGASVEVVQSFNAEAARHGIPVRPVSTGGKSKEERAELPAALAEAGNLTVLRGVWNAQFVDELCSFPGGAHDDVVDGLSGAVAQLASGGGGQGSTTLSLSARFDMGGRGPLPTPADIERGKSWPTL